MGARSSCLSHDARASKQIPFPKALAPHDRRVAYAKLVANMRYLSETPAEDDKSVVSVGERVRPGVCRRDDPEGSPVEVTRRHW